MRMTAINPNVKVKEIRTWNNMDFSLLMLRKGWKEPDLWVGNLTFGSTFVEERKPTNGNIYKLAEYIKNKCQNDERETVEHIMHLIFVNMVSVTFEIEEGE